MSGKPEIIQFATFQTETERLLNERFVVHRMPLDAAGRQALLARVGPKIGGIATTATEIIDKDLIAALPALRVIACRGAGLDNIDAAAASRRNIRITGTSHVLADEVADTALALMLAIGRGICEADRFVRAGEWLNRPFRLGRSLRGRKLGILGLGHIGQAVALRCDVLGMEIGYVGPRPKPVQYRRLDSLVGLATWCDVLLVSCPGGAATERLVDAAVLDALGPDGWLINIARGSIVDEAALIAALADNRIGGAGLDVFAHEPHVSAELIADDRVVLLPHIGSATVETRATMDRAMIRSLEDELLD